MPVAPLQADMMEILYRAAKQESLKDANIAFQGMPKAKAVFEYLVAKPLQVHQPRALCTQADPHHARAATWAVYLLLLIGCTMVS